MDSIEQQVRLITKPSPEDDVPIACTLDVGAVPERLDDWKAVLAAAAAVEPLEAGARVVFPAGTDPAPIAALAAAEQTCCQFFTFTLHIERTRVALDVTGPPDAQPVITALIGLGR